MSLSTKLGTWFRVGTQTPKPTADTQYRIIQSMDYKGESTFRVQSLNSMGRWSWERTCENYDDAQAFLDRLVVKYNTPCITSYFNKQGLRVHTEPTAQADHE